MGCLNSKEEYNRLEPSIVPKFVSSAVDNIYFHNEKDKFVRSKIIDSIKKCDLMLFQRILQKHQVKFSEILTPPTQRKAIVHFLAEYNFAQGMNYVLSQLLKIQSKEVHAIINARDFEGNTSAMICCRNNSVQTLEVIIDSEQADIFLKNEQGKSALDIALQKESACAKLISLHMTKPNGGVTNRTTGTFCCSQTTLRSTTNLGSALKSPEPLNTQDSPQMDTEPVKLLSSQDIALSFRPEDPHVDPSTRLYQIMEKIKAVKVNFIDDEFMHNNVSIISPEGFLEFFQKPTLLKWLRPSLFTKFELEELRIFDAIELPDLSKSQIVGCDFYSAIAAMTEFPQRLARLFITQDANIFGAYSVEYVVCGVPVEVVLDDYFPCYEDDKPVFSTPTNNEIWFPLLEKAMAKLFCNYAQIADIGITDAFEMLTGMPSYQMDLKLVKVDELWHSLNDSIGMNYMLCIGNLKTLNNLKKNRNYSVVDVRDVSDCRMLKVKTYHPEDKEICRKFNEKTKKWTKKFKEEVGYFEKEQDCFYLEISELILNFDYLSLCCYQEGWYRRRFDVVTDHKEVIYFEMTVIEPTEIFISLHQKFPCFIEEQTSYGISPVEIMLVEDLDNEFKLVECGAEEAFQGKSTVFLTDKIKIKLQEGKYILRTKVHWIDGMEHQFVLNTLSSGPVGIQAVESFKYPKFLEELYSNIAIQSKERFTFSNDCSLASSWTGPHLWLCGINSGKKTWTLEIVFDRMDNLKISKKYRDSEKSIKMVIPPGDKKIAFIKRLTPAEVAFTWKFNQKWE